MSICICSIISAQETAFFELPLYFEDAAGNKDTLIVGYDLNASDTEINENFDEVAITAPFDSIFEVRAYNSFHIDTFTNKFFSKKIILNPEQRIKEDSIICYVADGAKILFNAIHLPVKMYYDRDILNSRCVPEASFYGTMVCYYS